MNNKPYTSQWPSSTLSQQYLYCLFYFIGLETSKRSFVICPTLVSIQSFFLLVFFSWRNFFWRWEVPNYRQTKQNKKSILTNANKKKPAVKVKSELGTFQKLKKPSEKRRRESSSLRRRRREKERGRERRKMQMLNNGANYRTNSRREIFQSEILEKSFLGEGERRRRNVSWCSMIECRLGA